jgi:hypothetical protein
LPNERSKLYRTIVVMASSLTGGCGGSEMVGQVATGDGAAIADGPFPDSASAPDASIAESANAVSPDGTISATDAADEMDYVAPDACSPPDWCTPPRCSQWDPAVCQCIACIR